MVTVTLLTKPVSDERLKEFYAKVRPVGAWKRIAAAARAENPGLDTGARGQGLAVIIGWIGGAALIYGLIFLPGRWMLGDPWGPSLAVAAGGAIALKWAWRRAVA